MTWELERKVATSQVMKWVEHKAWQTDVIKEKHHKKEKEMKKYFQVTKIGTVGELKKKETAKVGKKQDKTHDAP